VTAASWKESRVLDLLKKEDGSYTPQHTGIHNINQPWICSLRVPLIIIKQGADINSHQLNKWPVGGPNHHRKGLSNCYKRGHSKQEEIHSLLEENMRV
jgi:hypothetical protein